MRGAYRFFGEKKKTLKICRWELPLSYTTVTVKIIEDESSFPNKTHLFHTMIIYDTFFVYS